MSADLGSSTGAEASLWGPADSEIKFDNDFGFPYTPFSQTQRLGKVFDWQSSDKEVNLLLFTYDDDTSRETDFHVVESQSQQRRPKMRVRQRDRLLRAERASFASVQRKMEREELNRPHYGKYHEQARALKDRRFRRNEPPRFENRGRRQERLPREPSVEVQSNWKLVTEIELEELTTVELEENEILAEPVDLLEAGKLKFFDTTFESMTSRAKKSLQRKEKRLLRCPARDDPIMQKFASEPSTAKVRVFLTDTVMAQLMAVPRSLYSFDVNVHRKGNVLFFSLRDESALYGLHVNETATEPPFADDSINSAAALHQEATLCDARFVQMATDTAKPPIAFAAPHPFRGALAEDALAPIAFRYRKWRVGDVEFVCRCEVEAASRDKATGELQLVTVQSLLEHDPLGKQKTSSLDWRLKLDSQMGAVLAAELKNNSNRLARLAVRALLAGTDRLCLGFVSRMAARENRSHVILAAASFLPLEFAGQVGIKMRDCWAQMQYLVQMCLDMPEDGDYVLLRDPNRSVLMFFVRTPSSEEKK